MMSNANLLTRTYRGEPYLKDAAKLKGTYDDIYVYDIADFCKLISTRELHKRRDMGESIYDIMSTDGVLEILDYVKTYTEIPLLVKTVHGVALIIPSLVPSTSLFVLSYVSVGGERLYAYCKQSGASVCYSGELEREELSENTALPRSLEQYCERYLCRIAAAFEGTARGQLLEGDITNILEERIYAISYYAGCSASVLSAEPIVAFGEFDFSLFTAFVFCFMIVARRYSRRNELALVLENKSFGISVMASMSVKGRQICDCAEIREFTTITDRKRGFFEYMCDGAVAHMRFSPVAKDWSYLNIKSPTEENNA